MEHLIEPLKNLGLTEKEARVYLALLQLGPSTPYQIAKKADLKRPTAYVIAEELVEKGLIVHVPGEEPKKFIARTPDSFFEEAENKLLRAKRVLPELRSFQKGTTEKPSMLYFEGVEGVKQAMAHRGKELQEKEIVGFFASAHDITPALNHVFFDYNTYRARHNIAARGITVDDPTLAPYFENSNQQKSTLDTFKFLPQDEYSARVSIEACDTFSRIVLMESAQALIIESPKLASAIKEVFNLVWKSLEGKYDAPKDIPLSGERAEEEI